MLQTYSALPFNITSGVTTLQGTAGRPIVDGSVSTANFDVRAVDVHPAQRRHRQRLLHAEPAREPRVPRRRAASQIEGLVEAFNLTNRANALTRNTTFGAGAFPSSPVSSFDTVTAVGDPRTLQFGRAAVVLEGPEGRRGRNVTRETEDAERRQRHACLEDAAGMAIMSPLAPFLRCS